MAVARRSCTETSPINHHGRSDLLNRTLSIGLLAGLVAIGVGIGAAIGNYGARGVVGGVFLIAGGGVFVGGSIYGLFYLRGRS